jgi:hypothetical protein
MELTHKGKGRIHFYVTVAFLLLMIVALGAALFTAVGAIDALDDDQQTLRRSLRIFSGLLIVCIASHLLWLSWILMRRIRRATHDDTLPDAPYVDAWEEAGRRMDSK